MVLHPMTVIMQIIIIAGLCIDFGLSYLEKGDRIRACRYLIILIIYMSTFLLG